MTTGATTTTKQLINQVAVKESSTSIGTSEAIGVYFDNVIDADTNCSLKTFFENYKAYITSVPFIYKGENMGQNEHVGIWIDTGATASDTWNKSNPMYFT